VRIAAWSEDHPHNPRERVPEPPSTAVPVWRDRTSRRREYSQNSQGAIPLQSPSPPQNDARGGMLSEAAIDLERPAVLVVRSGDAGVLRLGDDLLPDLLAELVDGLRE
jgi:hypothetical protein